MNHRYLFIVFFAVAHFACGQTISGTVRDANSGDPLAFASVIYGDNRGVITNEEGDFTITSVDMDVTLAISSMGYETVRLRANTLSEDPILLKPMSIALNEIFLTNKNLSGKEIIERIKNRVDSNYTKDFTKKRFFLRESSINKIRRFDLEVDESTIPELNQEFMDSMVNSVPRINDSYVEVLGDLYGNFDTQKIELQKIANLYDPKSTGSLDELTDRFENIISQNIKRDSYFKIRSGLIGTKVEAQELLEDLDDDQKNEIEEVKESLEEREKKEIENRRSYQKNKLNTISSLMDNMFWNEEMTFDVFEKSRKYRFTKEGYTTVNGETTYVIGFEPKHGADFKGRMFVDASDFGIYKIEYENVKPLKRFRLLGISYYKDVHNVRVIFSKGNTGKYDISYVEGEYGETFGVKRPLTIIEKNKNVKGRRKQNELDMDINIVSSQLEKYQLVIFSTEALSEEEYKKKEIKSDFLRKKFKSYDPEFWEGETIIQPNEAIKSFTVEDVIE